ncbi:MAG: TRAP transporter small permease [Hyphomicrobiales bacterium]
MIAKLNSIIDRVLQSVLATLFAGLIAVVFLQVAARNVFKIPVVWTLDLAQLIFSWCIFLGAALAFRYGGHYLVNLWKEDSRLEFMPRTVAFLASCAVIFVLTWHGTIMSMIGLNRTSLSLGISEFWFYLPIPLCGALMGLFLLEKLIKGDLK